MIWKLKVSIQEGGGRHLDFLEMFIVKNNLQKSSRRTSKSTKRGNARLSLLYKSKLKIQDGGGRHLESVNLIKNIKKPKRFSCP